MSTPLHIPLSQLLKRIQPADISAMQAARERQAQLTKPAGALGDLEDIAVRLAGVYGTAQPHPRGVAVVVCAADHGVAAEGVSAYPQAVTAAMVNNFLLDTPAGAGGAAVSAMARQLGTQVYVLDAGVASDLPPSPRLLRVGTPPRGTRNLRLEAAMTPEQATAAILSGAQVAAQAIAAGADMVVAGEMGIANTTAASALTARMLGIDAQAVTGRGTGIDEATLGHKVQVVSDALARHASQKSDPLGALADLGGLEIAAMLGVMLETAAQRRAVILDGFVEGAAALVGVALCPALRDYLFAAGVCAERGHKAQLDHLHLKPMFDLGLRLGEGTGGVLAAPLLLGAAASLREMLTFAEAGVPQG